MPDEVYGILNEYVKHLMLVDPPFSLRVTIVHPRAMSNHMPYTCCRRRHKFNQLEIFVILIEVRLLG